MLKETGRVVAIEKNALWVETIQQSTCSTCVAQKGCGQSLLARFSEASGHIRVLLKGTSPSNYQVNDRVTIGIPEDIVAKSSLQLYLLPVVFMLVFAYLAHTFFQHELVVILIALSGLFVGGIALSLYERSIRDDHRYQPIIVESDADITIVPSQN